MSSIIKDNGDLPKPEEANRVNHDPLEGPNNGGTSAWLSTFAAFLLFVVSWGPSTGFGAFQNFYQRDLLAAYSPSAIAWIGTVNATLLISCGVLAGPLFDRGYVKHLMVIGCVLAVVGEMMLSLSTEYYQVMLSQGFCAGVGAGLLYVPALAMFNTMFSTTKKRGVAMGIVTSGASLGGVIFPLVFLRLQPRIGFPWTVRVLGFVQLACSAMALPLLFAANKNPPKLNTPRKLIHWNAFRESSFNAYIVANFLMFMAYFIPLFYVPFFAIEVLHTSVELGLSLLAVVNGASAFGRLGFSLLALKIGAYKILPLVVLASSVVLFGWIGVDTLAGFVVFCVIFGGCSGALISANPVVAAHRVISPSTDVVGTRLGMQWFATALGVLVGAPIAGVLGEDGSEGAFRMLQGFSGAAMAGGFVFLLVPLSAMWRCDSKES